MFFSRLLWALPCLTVPVLSFSKAPVTDNDSLQAVSLREITIKASPVIHKADGNTYIPSGNVRKVSTSGLDFLSRMHLPRVSVNQMTGNVALAGGGTIRLCINGVEATSSDIAAVNPENIIRIEYHDNPGARYSDADAVIDFIVRNPDSGGNLAAETFTAAGSGKWATINTLSGSYNKGLSNFSVNGSLFGLGRGNWVRDYEERFVYPDGEVFRTETGMPVHISNLGLDAALSYSLQKERSYFFNARLSLSYNNVPNKEEGDRHTFLKTSLSDEITEIREHTRERSTSPVLGLYYRRYFCSTRSVVADVSGGVTSSGTNHSYCESVAGGEPNVILSDVSGKKYTLNASAYYEGRYGASAITAGIRHQQAAVSNNYTGDLLSHILLHQSESALFGEYALRTGKVGLSANLSLANMHSSQDDIRTDRLAFNPAAGISYEPFSDFTARYDVKLYHRQPPISTLNNVEQEIQPGLFRRGNPDLKSFRVIEQRLTLGYDRGPVSADLLVNWRDEHKPVMTSTSFDGTRFVTTYENQRSFRELESVLSLTVRPWAQHLSISLTPTLNRYFSRGNTYSHTRSIFHLGASVDFNYSNWLFSGSIMTGGANSMYGEELIHEKDMNMILAGYRTGNWTFQAGVFNAFMKEYWMKSENLSALTSYRSTAHCNRNTYGVIKISLNLNFGRKHVQEEEIRFLEPDDNDSGIINSIK